MLQQNKRVLIANPISNRAWILPHFLQHIYDLDYPKHLISFYFIVNNSTDDSLNMLKEFKEKYKSEYDDVKIEILNSPTKFKDDRVTQIREAHTYTWLSFLRNRITKQCVKGNHDYLFSCDSDILVSKDCLTRLLSHNLPYVASLIYNGYLFTPPNSASNYDSLSMAYKFPNILKYDNNTYVHIVNYKVKNPNLNPVGTLIETDFTGASFVASKDVCKVMEYDWHKQGEDLPASLSAKKAGYTLYCDASVYSQHIMSEELLHKYLNGELKYANGDVIKI